MTIQYRASQAELRALETAGPSYTEYATAASPSCALAAHFVVKRACIECAAAFEPVSPTNRRCPACLGDASGVGAPRDTAAQKRFRDALVRRAGGRCEAIEEDGERCDVTDPAELRACHFTPITEGGGYDPADGALLCSRHDQETERERSPLAARYE